MAGDWIKIEITTPDKPEVIAIAAGLRIDQDAVVGKLIRLWSWADLNSVDGNSLCVTAKFIDRLCNKKGFAEALRNAGWLQGKDGCLTFPDFSRHNGKTAKLRGETARRQTKHRAKSNAPGVTDALQKASPEKEKEYLKRERERPAADFPKSVTQDDDHDLRDHIISLRPAWQAAPAFSPDEETAFQAALPLLRQLPAESWDTQRRYLAARLPEGAVGFQPVQLIAYLRKPNDIARLAADWHRKQPQPPAPKPAAPPPDESENATPEDIAALADFLKPARVG